MYWKPQSVNSLVGATKALNASLAPTTQTTVVEGVELPKVGDKILLQVYPWGMTNVYDVETGTPSPQATYIEVEVQSLKKAKITFE